MADPIIQQLTAPGAPFELIDAQVNNMQCRLFRDTPPCLPHIFSALAEYAHHDLAVYADRRLTYRQASEQAGILAQYLKAHLRVGEKARVAIVMRNAPEWLVAFIAVTALGAIPALVNGRGAPDEIAHCLKAASCQLLITDIRTEEHLESTDSNTLPCITFDLTQAFTLKGETQSLTCEGAPEAPPVTESLPDDPAMILFTSGTTGRPKGVLLTHRGVLTALKTNQLSSAVIARQMAQKYGIDLETLTSHQASPCTLLMFPLFHVSGCEAVFLTGLLQGSKIVMMPKWDATEALRLMEAEKVTMFPGVPTMFWDILRLPRCAQGNLPALTSVSVAGQATPLPLFTAIKEAFPAAIIGCGYGMTETNGAISLLIGDELIAHPASVGHPLATTEVKLMQDEHTPAPSGEQGEIYVRGATIMQGYDNNPEANNKSFLEGWYGTGDIGKFDPEGRLYIVDRATEMVISSGENIYCAEVERVLDQAKGVLESVTFGVPDDRLGERLVALVRADEGSAPSAETIADFARTKLAGYKIPSEIHVLSAPLPRTETGKLIKRIARQWHKQLTDPS